MSQIIEPPTVVNAYVDYDANLVLMHRDGDERIVRRMPADFASYHRVSDVTPEKRSRLEMDDGLRTMRREGDWYRVEWYNYKARRFAIQDDGILTRLRIPHFEADVHPVKRYLVDSGAKIQRPRRAFLDIETDSRLSFAKLRAGQGRVLCWTVVNEVGKVVSGCLAEDTDKAEQSLLVELLRTLDDYDQVLAWNGDGFDFMVLNGDRHPQTRTKGRIRHLGIKVDMRRWLWLDHMALFKRMNLQVAKSGDEKQSFKLGDIARSVLHDGKDKFDASKAWEAWACTDPTARYNRDALVRYNQKDTDLLRRIEEKTGFCALLDTIGDACGVLPDSRGMRPLNQLDPFMLRLGREQGTHFPTITRFEQEDDRKKFKGAFVQEPSIAGMLRDVHVCDFKSLYPSIIISWNMSPETKVPGSRGSMGPIPENCSRAPYTGVMFRTDVQGLLPMAVGRLLELRAQWKTEKSKCAPGTPESASADRKSNAYKVTGNAFFGGTGNEFSRFFDVDVAESVTQAGVHLIHAVDDAAVRLHWEPVYADTDGDYVRGISDRRVFGEFVKETLNGEVIPQVLAEHGCVTRTVSIAYEKQFDRIVFTGMKKRYFGKFLHYEGTEPKLDSEPEIKGLEFKRGDTNHIARVLQERIIRMILGDWQPTCSCGKKCDHGPDDKAPKDRRTAWLWTCPRCGPREDSDLHFAVAMENPEDFRVVVERARDHVLSAKLPLAYVTVSKGLQQPIEDYVQKKKQDGTDAALPPHVQVAKLLSERGEDVSIGTKIAYVVADGADTIKAIPADDYVGECDRHYLWQNLVWPPIERILTVVFPGTPWDRMFSHTRPAKERPPKRGGAAPGQVGLFGGGIPPLDLKKFTPITVDGTAGRPAVETIRTLGAAGIPAMRRSDRPFVIRLGVERATREVLAALREACDKHPGPRPVQLSIDGTIECLGEASVDVLSGVKVVGARELIAEIGRILGR